MNRRVVLAAVAACLTCFAHAQPQTNVTTPTAWVTQSNVSLAVINDQIDAGFRIVDIEVENANPLTFSATFVQNTGDYAKGWWWYFGQTEQEVNDNLAANNARLIDIEPYETNEGLRFAVVMIHNVGDDFAPQHGWFYGFTGPDIDDWVDANPTFRIIDIQPYFDGGQLRYAIVVISNTGQNASGWWYYYNVSTSFISDRLNDNNARLIDLEETFPDSGTWSCVMVPVDGQAWWWFHGITSFSDIEPITNQLGARIIDYQRYFANGQLRFAMILRRNTNDLTQNINIPMRNTTDGVSGFLLQRLNGPEFAAINRNFVFEPASLLKTLHHVHAMRQVALGNDALPNLVTLNTQTMPGASCPAPLTPPQFPTLTTTLQQMMGVSSNSHTEAIRQRYGTAAILNTAAALNMVDTELNHTLGCLCSQGVNNWLTLTDLYRLHSAVGAGYVNPFRDEFYNFMRNSLTNNPANGLNNGMPVYQDILDSELASSSLQPAEQTAFRNRVFQATKDGSYTCGGGAIQHRTEGGYLRVPVRQGCVVRDQEFFFGGFVFNATNGVNAANAVNIAMIEMFRDRIRFAIDSWQAEFCCSCEHADINGDLVVDFDDLSTVLSGFGQVGPNLPGDINGDGVVDFEDLSCILSFFGQFCITPG